MSADHAIKILKGEMSLKQWVRLQEFIEWCKKKTVSSWFPEVH